MSVVPLSSLLEPEGILCSLEVQILLWVWQFGKLNQIRMMLLIFFLNLW